MPSNRLWIIGSALLAVIIVGGGYMLGIAPRLESASAATQDRAGVEQSNDLLEIQLASLKTDFDKIGEYRAERSALRASVPPDVEAAAFITQVNAVAESAGVVVNSVTMSDGVFYPGPLYAAAALAADQEEAGSAPSGPADDPAGDDDAADATTVDQSDPATDPDGAGTGLDAGPNASSAAEPNTAADGADAGAADDVAAPAPVVEPSSALVTSSNFVAIPVNISVTGENTRALAFLGGMQSGTRLVLVDGVTSAVVDVPGAAATEAPGKGEPSIAPGAPSVQLDLSGYIYVLAG